MSTATSQVLSRTAAVAALLVLLVAMALLAPPAAPAAPTLFPVCIELGGQAGPEISGKVVVWTDNRNGNLDIYGRNLSTGAKYSICTNSAQQDNPSVTKAVVGAGYQYRVVWADKRNHRGGDATDIYGRNITKKTSFVVVRSASTKWFPVIVDHWVVWIEADASGGPYRIKAHDIATGKNYLLATSKTFSPVGLSRRMVGTKLVYTAVYATAKGDISARNVPTGTPFTISKRTTFEWSPDISGSRVVWWEAGGRVMLKNLKTGKRTFVANGARPRINGTRVTWDNGGHGGAFVITYNDGADIFVRDVTRTRTARISRAHQTLLFPALSGSLLVFESGPATRILSNVHIWGARL